MTWNVLMNDDRCINQLLDIQIRTTKISAYLSSCEKSVSIALHIYKNVTRTFFTPTQQTEWNSFHVYLQESSQCTMKVNDGVDGEYQ